MPERYRAELLTLVESFEFVLCETCGGDVHEHVFAPDMLGHPHMFCVRDDV